MYLHQNIPAFRAIVQSTHSLTGVPYSLIEKDYYVFLLLKYIAVTSKDEVVFKGGTSLSKAWGIISRFSEDIDLCLPQTKVKNKGARKRLVNAVVSGIDNLQLQYKCEKLEHCGVYNDIQGFYQQQFKANIVTPFVKVEIANRTPEFPVALRTIDSYVGAYLRGNIPDNIYMSYELMPFQVNTVVPARTFVDKTFAVADYYLLKKVTRYSRHLYDLYKLMEIVDWSDPTMLTTLKALYMEVAILRRGYRRNASTQDGIDHKAVLYEALRSDYYKNDYYATTYPILFDKIPYEVCRDRILWMLDNSFLI